MKTFTHILPLTTLLLSTSLAAPAAPAPCPAPAPAPTPSGYIVAFSAAQCTTTDALGSTTGSRQTAVLPLNACNLISSGTVPTVMSFEGGIVNPCPKGTTAHLTVYQSPDCTANQVTSGADAGTLPVVGPGDCKNILPMGRSARFTCT